jgi:hypothetical protein
MLPLPSSLAFAFVLYSTILLSCAIPLDNDSGILYRFSPISENEIEEIISWAEVRLAIVAPKEIIEVFFSFRFSFYFYSCANGIYGK